MVRVRAQAGEIVIVDESIVQSAELLQRKKRGTQGRSNLRAR